MSNPIRRLPMAAAIYASGDFLLKGASFLLLPLLTRYLAPRDYGIVGSVTAFSLLLGLVLQLNFNSAVMRFYGDFEDESERQEFTGSLIVFSIVWSIAIVVLLNIFGPVLLNHVYKEVRFEPYLRIGIWIALFNTMAVLPLALMQIQQRPGMHRLFTIGTFLLNTLFMLVFVVHFGMGAYGALIGQLIGSGIAAIAHLALARPYMTPAISGKVLRMCLGFSMPLLVYSLGGWAVDTSNRLFIERFVSLDQLGLFNIASQFAMILGYLLNGVGLAFTPLFYETVRMPDGARTLARFGLIYIAAAFGLGLLLAVFSKDAIDLMTQPRFHGAYRVVPILTATQALTSFWHLIVNPLMLKKRTGSLMGIMLGSAVVSIGLNVWLVPKYGIVGAALAALAGNVMLNVITSRFSIRAFPVPYDYQRIAIVTISAVTLCVAALTRSGFAARVAVVSLYPALLWASGVVDRTQLQGLLKVRG